MKYKDISFKNVNGFVNFILNRAEDNDELFITVVAKFDDMKNIVKYIMFFSDVNFEKIDMESPEISGYEDEYILTLWLNDDVFEIGCEPLKADGRYSNPCGDEVYLFGDCCSRIMQYCKDCDLYIVYANDDFDCGCGDKCSCECYEDDAHIEYSKSEDGDIHGFTASKSDDDSYYSFSYYTNDIIDQEGIHDMLKDLGF